MKFIAMNRFKIALNRESDFENIWEKRETHLSNVPGFIEFHLVKGKTEDTHTLYASHSTWERNFCANFVPVAYKNRPYLRKYGNS